MEWDQRRFYAESRQNGIICNYFAAFNRVQNMAAFYTALVQALQKARERIAARRMCCS